MEGNLDRTVTEQSSSSSGGELGAFPLWGKLLFTTDGGLTLIPLRNKVPHLAEGWHEVPGWSNAHRPCCGGGGVSSRAMTGGGLSPEALAKGDLSRVTSNY